KESMALAPSRPLPRDPRGHLHAAGTSFQVFLPGTLCNGSTDPALTMECRASEESWVIESGSRALLLGVFAPGRNYFDGHVTTQAGVRKSVGPFYAAASVEDRGRTMWLL